MLSKNVDLLRKKSWPHLGPPRAQLLAPPHWYRIFTMTYFEIICRMYSRVLILVFSLNTTSKTVLRPWLCWNPAVWTIILIVFHQGKVDRCWTFRTVCLLRTFGRKSRAVRVSFERRSFRRQRGRQNNVYACCTRRRFILCKFQTQHNRVSISVGRGRKLIRPSRRGVAQSVFTPNERRSFRKRNGRRANRSGVRAPVYIHLSICIS